MKSIVLLLVVLTTLQLMDCKPATDPEYKAAVSRDTCKLTCYSAQDKCIENLIGSDDVGRNECKGVQDDCIDECNK